MTENEIGTVVLEVAMAIHQELGPGLLETVYEVILARELSSRGLGVERQVAVPIVFNGVRFDEGFRADLIVGGRCFWSLSRWSEWLRCTRSRCRLICG